MHIDIAGPLAAIVLALGSETAFVTEPLPPLLTRDTAVGEWAGIAQGPSGESFLFVLDIPAQGVATLAQVHSRDRSDVFIREIADLKITDGRIQGMASGVKFDGSQPGPLTVAGEGRAMPNIGWMNLTLGNTQGVTHNVRFVKQPDRFFRLLQAMVRTGRNIIATSRRERGQHRSSPNQRLQSDRATARGLR